MPGEAVSVPSYDELMWPTLCAVRELGHSARLAEIDEKVITDGDFSEAQLAVLHNEGPSTEIEYRLAWARTYLKGIGALASASRGVWETTARGRELSEGEVEPLLRECKATLRKRQAQKRRAAKANGGEAAEPDAEGSERWKEELIEQMLSMSPTGFEHLAQRLLRAAGFVNTRVTGRTGDGGIDGMGVYQVSLVSFPVLFQCKRYRGAVSSDKVRDFRGAMAGRGDKGLLITTGTFTRDARNEATREGAPPIDLIDGERLCELLKKHQLGVRTTLRQVEDVAVQREFFEDLG